MLLNIRIQINWFSIFNKYFAQLAFPHAVDVFEQIIQIGVLKFATYHLISQITCLKYPVVMHTNWHYLNVVFQLLQIVTRFKQQLNRALCIKWKIVFSSSEALVVLE